MRAPRVTLAALFAAACTGVLFNQGNDFPCDFSRPAGERDGVCAAGDVCGVANRCQRYVYEGPRFEGAPTFPDFSVDAGAGAVLHPRILFEPLTTIAGAGAGAFVRTSSGQYFSVSDDGLVSPLPNLGGPAPGALAAVLRGLVSLDADGGELRFLPGNERALLPDGGVLRATRMRAFVTSDGGAPSPRLLAVSSDGVAGEVLLGGPQARFLPLVALGPDAGGLDIGLVERAGTSARIVVTRDALLVELDGGFQAVSGPVDFGEVAVLKRDAHSNVLAVVYDLYRDKPPLVLSTWTVQRTAAGYSLTPAWPDCTPCGELEPGPARGNEFYPVAFTPTFSSGGASVEVLCRSQQALALVRVLGSVAQAPRQRCDAQLLGLPFDGQLLAVTPGGLGRPVADDTLATGVALGGTSGQVWLGGALSALQPAFLDRVPMDVTVLEDPRSQPVVAALTDRYLAVQLAGGNGFRALQLRDPRVGTQVPLGALVHEGRGWAVTASGDLARFLPGPDGGLGYGPRLVDGRGAAVTRPLLGEAIGSLDGGLVSMLVAADDGVYLVPAGFTPADTTGVFAPVSPNLTPEPSTFIRSLALERTPVGTNGVDRVRGYLVTSRNLYAFALAGTPPRWSATPLVLAGGEPLEVWMDNPRGGLGRVGFRDGQVYTLPGGFLLVDRLPGGDGGVAPQVLDYENLGGWPVALTTSGLWVALYDKKEGVVDVVYGTSSSARLDNRFPDGGVNKPMTWREVTLPDGTRPWVAGGRARPGRLFVKVDAQVQVKDAAGVVTYQRVFHLLLFLDDRVLEVGRHVRVNTSVVTQ